MVSINEQMQADPTAESAPSWTTLADAPAEAVNNLARCFLEFSAGMTQRVLVHLKLLEGDCGGFPVSRLEHCVQTATRAQRANESEEYVVCALLHDIGDTLSTLNHPEVAAAILKPYVSEELYWVVRHHDFFQGYYYMDKIGLDRNEREQFRGHPYFGAAAKFVAAYDNPSFDPGYDSMPLEAFEPIVRRVFANPKHGRASEVMRRLSREKA